MGVEVEPRLDGHHDAGLEVGAHVVLVVRLAAVVHVEAEVVADPAREVTAVVLALAARALRRPRRARDPSRDRPCATTSIAAKWKSRYAVPGRIWSRPARWAFSTRSCTARCGRAEGSAGGTVRVTSAVYSDRASTPMSSSSAASGTDRTVAAHPVQDRGVRAGTDDRGVPRAVAERAGVAVERALQPALAQPRLDGVRHLGDDRGEARRRWHRWRRAADRSPTSSLTMRRRRERAFEVVRARRHRARRRAPWPSGPRGRRAGRRRRAASAAERLDRRSRSASDHSVQTRRRARPTVRRAARWRRSRCHRDGTARGR